MTRDILIKRIVACCVGGAILLLSCVYIARNFQWREIIALVSGADLEWFFIGGSAAIVAYWMMRAIRWRFLLRGMQSESDFIDLYLCSSVALSLSMFTPLQSGEVLKIELLKKYGSLPRLPGYSAFLLERVADLYVVVAMGVVALASPSGSLVHAVVLATAFMVLPIAGYLVLHTVRLPGRIGEFVGHLQSGISTPATLFVLLLLTFLIWAMVALVWQACLLSLSIGLGLMELLGLVSIVTLASIISFIPGGLGVAEAGITEVLIRYGISAPQAQAGALMLRALSLLIILLGAIHWLLLRARRKRRH